MSTVFLYDTIVDEEGTACPESRERSAIAG